MIAAGVLGLGTFLPSEVRTNAWWPGAEVDRWRDKMALRATSGEGPALDTLSEGARRTIAAMNEVADDPFRGARERRVMTGDLTADFMEAAAAREAMEAAGVGPKDIGAILVQTPCPEYLMVNHACLAHERLGLPEGCLTLSTEAACNGFALHVTLAQGLIASGAARHVLSIHSSAITRVHGPVEPHSAWWGDGAAAAVIGPVRPGQGLLATSHHTAGSRCDALVLGVPGSRWWDPGAITTHSLNRDATRDMLLGMVERGREAVHDALGQVGLDPADVDFYATHQSTAWLTRVSKAYNGLDRAQTLITFPMLGNMNSVNVPFILARGVREGLIGDGSIVATFSGGLGETWSSLVFRWGR